MKLPKLNKTAIIGLAVTTGLVVGGATVSRSEAALDWLGIEQKLQRQDEQLENHEGRITNTENDVKDVQANTGTAPSTDKVIVKEVFTPQPTTSTATTPTSEPKTQPITIVAYEVIPISEYRTDCKWTYSDGTTNTFTWKSGSMTAGACDSSVIGTLKD